jgi:hypothetical protein
LQGGNKLSRGKSIVPHPSNLSPTHVPIPEEERRANKENLLQQSQEINGILGYEVIMLFIIFLGYEEIVLFIIFLRYEVIMLFIIFLGYEVIVLFIIFLGYEVIVLFSYLACCCLQCRGTLPP